MDDSEIYETCKRELHQFAITLVGRDEAHDIVSTVILRLFESGRNLEDLQNPKGYLMTAIFNEARSTFRRRARRARLDDKLRANQVNVHPSDSDAHWDLVDAIVGLPIRQKSAVVLTYWFGMTSEQVAQVMGVKSSTVRRYLHIGRAKLQRRLADG